jgi:endogenous inhibitor of DNA gyrase (YacG/DUF329 family)
MKQARCPICDRQVEGPGAAEWPEFPFCSSRCRLIDLGRWLGEAYSYRVPAEEEDFAAPAEGSDRETDTP